MHVGDGAVHRVWNFFICSILLARLFWSRMQIITYILYKNVSWVIGQNPSRGTAFSALRIIAESLHTLHWVSQWSWCYPTQYHFQTETSVCFKTVLIFYQPIMFINVYPFLSLPPYPFIPSFIPFILSFLKNNQILAMFKSVLYFFMVGLHLKSWPISTTLVQLSRYIKRFCLCFPSLKQFPSLLPVIAGPVWSAWKNFYFQPPLIKLRSYYSSAMELLNNC